MEFTIQSHNNSDIGQWLKLSFRLHFIDPKEVEDYFVDELMADAPQDDRCKRYMDYPVDNYTSLNSKYPPVLRDEIPSHTKRTNNAAEFFHAHFIELFYTFYPSIYVFLDVLVKPQRNTYIKMRSISKPATVRKPGQNRNEYDISQKSKYIAGEIDRHN